MNSKFERKEGTGRENQDHQRDQVKGEKEKYAQPKSVYAGVGYYEQGWLQYHNESKLIEPSIDC